MLNIAPVNMPKIKPETKVLIIKNLKSKSPAEVADIFNLPKQQVERIHKCYQETGDVDDRPKSGRPCKTTAREQTACWSASQLQEEWTPVMPVSSRTVSRILARNGLHGRIAAYAKAHSLTEGWTAEHFSDESSVELHPKRCQYCQ